jgi:hypothetical protein
MLKKRMFLCGLMAVALVGMVDRAHAQPAPYSDTAVLAIGQTVVDWDVPAATYGPLLSLQALGLTNAATLKVDHLVSYGNGTWVTNAVEAAAAQTTLHVYPAEYLAPQYYCTNTTTGTTLVTTPVKPVWLVPGDKLRFTASAAHGSAGTVIIRAGFPGK